MPFPIPASLREHVSESWLAGLAAVVAGLAERWSLRVEAPFDPGGYSSWVAPARDPAGRDLVLKAGWRHPEAEHEPAGLAHWNGRAAVILYETETLDETIALLLERCRPGTPLRQARPEPEQDTVIANLLSRLWYPPPPGHPYRSLQVMCDMWADGFVARHGPDGTGAAEPGVGLDPGLVRAGLARWRELPGTAERELVLCTDLHAGNVLAAEREPWLAIDPKPYVGDPTYDVLQHLVNCPDRLLADPAALLARMAGLLDLDPDRLTQWAFARCVLAAPTDARLRRVAELLAPA